MKILKVIGLFMAIMLLAVLAFQGIANDACRPAEKKSAPVKKEEVKKAEEKTYVIKKGDTFWSIAEKEYGNPFKWINIQKANPELIPEKLPIGKRIIIPVSPKTEKPVIKTVKTAKKKSKKAKAKRAEKTSVKLQTLEVFDISDPEGLLRTLGQKKIFGYKKPGGNRFKGDIIKGLEYLLIPEGPKKLLEEKIKGGVYEIGWVDPGDIFLMLYGNYELKLSQNQTGRRLDAKVYVVEYGGYKYTLKWVESCKNPTRYPEVPIEVPPEILKVKPPEEKIPPPLEVPKMELIYPKEPEQPKVEFPEEPKMPVTKIELPKCELAPEHEPIVGIYGYKNNVASGYGAFAEYVLWLRKSCEKWGYIDGWVYGVDLFGHYTRGSSDISTFDWREGQVGIGPALKYIGSDNKGRFWMWQGKVRFLREWMHGGNTEGYKTNQRNWNINPYMEIVKRANPNLAYGLQAEAIFSIDREMVNSSDGASPSDRTQLMLSAFTQQKISDKWQVRETLMPAWTGWDRQTWLNVFVEGRYKETVMFGPSIGIPLGVSNLNRLANLDWKDLFTLRGFARIEFGEPMRNFYYAKMAKRPKLIGGPEFESRQNSLDNIEGGDSVKYLEYPVLSISPVKTADY